MKRVFYVILLVLWFVPSEMKAQYDVSFSHYFDMEPSFNAAAVGKDDKLNASAAYALDMAGFKNNPQTAYAGADAAFQFLNTRNGAGVQLLNDKIGLFTHKRLALQYAYKHRLFGGGISIGAQIGMLSENFDGSRLEVDDKSDPALAFSEVNGNALDVGIGIYYNHKDWYVGASVQHINSPLVELGETNQLKVDATYYLTGGYNIKLRNPFLTIKSSVLARTDGVGYRADVTGRLVYTNEKKMMYGGLSYSPTNSVTVLIGGTFHGVVLGYSYEVYTSGINPGNGSHELYLGYQMDLNLAKKGRNRHQSVRIL